MKKPLVRDTIKYLPNKIVTFVVGFFSVPLLTRLFKPEDFGNYNLVLATVSFFSIAFAWISQSFIRFYPEYEQKGAVDEFNSTAVKLTLATILVTSLSYYTLLWLRKSSMSTSLYLLYLAGGGMLATQTIFNMLTSYLRVKRNINTYTVVSTIKVAGAFCIGIAIVLALRVGIHGLIIGNMLVLLALTPYLYQKAIRKMEWKLPINKQLAVEMALFSIPLVLSNISALIISLSDRFFISHFRNAFELGLYSANYNLIDHTINAITSLLLLSSYPLGVKIFTEKGSENVKLFESQAMQTYLFLSVPAVIGIIILPKEITALFMGNEYATGYVIAPIIAVGSFLFGMQQRYQGVLLYYKKTKFITTAILTAAIVNVLLNILFIPLYGSNAAAITTAVSYLIMLILMIVFSKKYLSWKFPFKYLFKVLFVTLLMSSVIIYLKPFIMKVGKIGCGVLGVIGMAVYFGVYTIITRNNET